MTIKVFDATNILVPNIPLNAPGIAYYKDGRYAWTQAQIDSFPTQHKISIATKVATDAMVLDVENGDSTPADVPGWLDRNSSNIGYYCNLNTLPQVVRAIGNRAPLVWLAIPGASSIPVGANAVQNGYFGIYDTSLFEEVWWPFLLVKEKDMIMVRNEQGSVSMFNGAHKTPVTEPTSMAAFSAAGILTVNVTDAEYAAIPNAQ